MIRRNLAVWVTSPAAHLAAVVLPVLGLTLLVTVVAAYTGIPAVTIGMLGLLVLWAVGSALMPLIWPRPTVRRTEARP